MRTLPLFLMLTVAGCDCGDRLQPATGQLSVEPHAIDFGEVRASQNAVRSLTLTNRGNYRLTLGNIELQNSRASFSRAPLPRELTPGQSVTIELGYRAPDEAGDDLGALIIAADSDATIEVELHGRSVLSSHDGGFDAGIPDAGTPDAGASDAGPSDAGMVDAGVHDAGTAADAGPLDAGSLDAGSLDAGSPDAGPLDAGPLLCPEEVTSRDLGDLRSALPSMVWWGAGYTAVIDQVVTENPFALDLFLEKTDAQGKRLAGPVQITAPGGQSSLWPRIDFSGSEYGVTFLHDNLRRATFMRANAQLGPIAGSTVPLGQAEAHTAAAVAWSQGAWGVAWSTSAGSIWFQRLDPQGAALAPAFNVGSGWIGDSGHPLIATPHGWAIFSTGSSTLFEVAFDETVRAVTLPFTTTRTSLALNGSEYGVVAGDNGVHFARVQMGGGIVPGSVATVGGVKASVPNIIVSQGQFVITWSETVAGAPQPLMRAIVPAHSTSPVVSGSPFTLVTNAGFHHLVAGTCGYAVSYGLFTLGSLYQIEVHP